MKPLITLLLISVSTGMFGATLNWNLASLYGVSQQGFIDVVAAAKSHFNSNAGDTIIVHVDAGTYNIGGNGNEGISMWSGMNPGSNGRLIFQGAGMDHTTLVFTEVQEVMIRARNMNQVTFRDMTFTRNQYTVTQGHVVSKGPGEIVLDIQDGFPSPGDLFALNVNIFNGARCWMRRYTNSTTDPLVIQTNNNQINWGLRGSTIYPPEDLGNNHWRFFLKNANQLLNNYQVGELIGIKIKIGGFTHYFKNCQDILFENIRWTHSTRGVARLGSNNIVFRSCRWERAPAINGQTPCMSSAAGGPQMSQDPDSPAKNMIVDNCFIDSPGDDCVAFFSTSCGKVLNSVVRNSFARGILITSQGTDMCISNNIVFNNPIQGNYTTCAGSTQNIEICESYTTNTGLEITSTTTGFTDLLPMVNDCQEVVYKNITINQPSTANITATLNGSYTAPSGNYTWTTLGTYQDTIMNAQGCDSVLTITLAAALPVVLLDFSAALHDTKVELNWQVAQQQNNAFFVVEKSTDLHTWAVVEQIQGAGNTPLPMSYRAIDHEPFSRSTYYRLQQIDFDGQKTSYPHIIVHKKITGVPNWSCYPNPVQSILYIESERVDDLMIYDVYAKPVLQLTQINKHNKGATIDFSGLQQGVYFVKIGGEVQKVIKE